MEVVEPTAVIVFPQQLDATIGVYMLQMVEEAARISHASEDRKTADSWKRFIETVVLQHGDWSVTEHMVVSVDIIADRGITHEIVRHRIAAYTQSSTRFIRSAQGIRVIVPGDVKAEDRDEWLADLATAESVYLKWLNRGYAPQIARSHLPHATAAKIRCTYNLRTWRHFFLMRTSLEAHPQMREVTIPLLALFKQHLPLLFDDIQPNQRQAQNMRLPR